MIDRLFEVLEEKPDFSKTRLTKLKQVSLMNGIGLGYKRHCAITNEMVKERQLNKLDDELYVCLPQLIEELTDDEAISYLWE